MKTTDFAAHMIRYFTRYLVNEKGSSPQTVDSYRNAFLLYFEYMESRCGIRPEKLTVSDYTSNMIREYPFITEVTEGTGEVTLSADEHRSLSKFFKADLEKEEMERKQHIRLGKDTGKQWFIGCLPGR